MAIVKNLASVMTTANITSSATSIPVNRTNVFGASQNPLDNPFYVTIMPASGSEPANTTNSEIALVTGISGSNLIVTRGQRSTTARAFTAGAIVTNGIYAEDAVLLGEAGTAVNPQPWVRPADIVWSELLDKIYPVGSIFMSATLSTTSSVATALGGTWVAWGAGRVPVGIGTVEANNDDWCGHTSAGDWTANPNSMGGETYHKLTVSEMPSHSHNTYFVDTGPGGSGYGKKNGLYANGGWWGNSQGAPNVGNTGGNAAHNNMMPYITCYMYKRIG